MIKHVGIVGLGYVGLPLAAEFAQRGAKVTGFDICEAVVETVNRGVSHIEDVPSVSGIRATSNASDLSACDAIVICVPTPLDGDRKPDLSAVDAAIGTVLENAKDDALIVLESTSYPGTTRERLLSRARRSQMVAFSPERIDPGNERYGVKNTPKVVGGADHVSLGAAVALYSMIVDTVVPVSSLETAEMVKLLENTFRAVNIALVNELANAGDSLGVDMREVIQAASTKPFGFMPFYPGAGVGGHCIPVDPVYLSEAMKARGADATLIESACQINRERPIQVVDALEKMIGGLGAKKVVLVGVAYKSNVSDTRESPAEAIADALKSRGATVEYLDDRVNWDTCHRFSGGHADAAIVVTMHSEMRAAGLGDFPLVLDCTGTLTPSAKVFRV